MNRSTSWLAVLPSLVIPLCLGLTMYLGMSVMLEKEVITNETIIRYVAGHPVSKLTVALFFVGIGSLAMISLNLFKQYRWAPKITLKRATRSSANHFDGVLAETAMNSEGSNAEDTAENYDAAAGEDIECIDGVSEDDAIVPDPERAALFGKRLLKYPQFIRDHYLWRRLHDALHYIHRTGSSSGIEDELKYLGDLDNDCQQQRYSLVRILIWATPMLGFLGTVLGISQALGGIDVGADNDFQQMLGSLRGSLYIAFDTTALALILSMVLMFGQFFVDRFESQLLRLIDYCSRRELSTHFVMSSTGDSTLDSVQRLGRTVLAANHDLVRQQTEIWRTSISAAEKAWTETLTGANENVSSNLTSALDHSVESLASYLGQAIQRADDSMVGRLEQWQVSLSDNARRMQEHQDELSRHTTLISQMLDKIGTVGDFHSALATNEEALAATGHLQQTLEQLVTTVKAASEKEPFIRIVSNTVGPQSETVVVENKLPVQFGPFEENERVLGAETRAVETTMNRSESVREKLISTDSDDNLVSIPFSQQPEEALPAGNVAGETKSDAKDLDNKDLHNESLPDESVDIVGDLFAIAGAIEVSDADRNGTDRNGTDRKGDGTSDTHKSNALNDSVDAVSNHKDQNLAVDGSVAAKTRGTELAIAETATEQATANETAARYLRAEQESGVAPSLIFPVQIIDKSNGPADREVGADHSDETFDLTKKAA